MRLSAFILALALAATPPCLGEETASIPLKDIWAYEMPGTKSVGDLDVNTKGLSNRELMERSLVYQVNRALMKRPKANEPMGRVFAVPAEGKEALKLAAEFFKEGDRDQWRYLPQNTPLTAVFYAHASSRYIRIEEVKRDAENFTIKYRAVPHTTANVTTHFALIPIGIVPEGTSQIKVVELPPLDREGNPDPKGRSAANLVCQTSSFGIR